MPIYKAKGQLCGLSDLVHQKLMFILRQVSNE